jgi:dynein heavy chain 1
MVWFSEDVINTSMRANHYLQLLKRVPLKEIEEDPAYGKNIKELVTIEEPTLAVQEMVVNIIEPFVQAGGLMEKALSLAKSLIHIMEYLESRALCTLFSLINQTVRNVLEYNNDHPDFPMGDDHLLKYLHKRFIYSLIWSLVGDSTTEVRNSFCQTIMEYTNLEYPNLLEGETLLDYFVDIQSGDWHSWKTKIPVIDIETHSVTDPDVIIPTVDTARHEDVIYSWVADHKPLLLCGPPGSGKTMSLFSALRKLPDMEVVGLNFSSATTPEIIQKTLEQHCEYRKTPEGVVLSPVLMSKWLILFCDEINLPAQDTYGTQRVISFLRQIIEQNGFWKPGEKIWVKLNRVQIVGACNPPTDPGRIPLTHRFLRHAPVIMMDYPVSDSLKRIYGTFMKAVLKVIPSLRAYSEPLTNAMVEFYDGCRAKFTADVQAHYIYSPRELTRWMRGIYEALKPLDDLDVVGLVRLFAHEALRLFQDRLVSDDEKLWTDTFLDEVALSNFPGIHDSALVRPILFSNWLHKHYVPVQRDDLRDFVRARLKVFYEEELDVPLVLFDHFLEHALRIDRIFSQPQGHLLLIGMSGSGKTTLARFVAWMNGYSIVQINIHNNYTGADFDDDLKSILRRTGCKGEKICFIMDESNVMESSFLERMNTLLANAEIPGLFEGEEQVSLLHLCKESAMKDGLLIDSSEELQKWFRQQVMKNLHVVFTMNPPEDGLSSRAATSPALFNRCVIDWFGNWSPQSYYQVGKEFTSFLDLDINAYEAPDPFPKAYSGLSLPPSHREALINSFVFVHSSLDEVTAQVKKNQNLSIFVTPRHFLDFISQYSKIYTEKREELEDQQRHVNVGLEKLQDTVEMVESLRQSLAIKKNELETKTTMANDKLKGMVKDQQEAEKKKAASLKIQTELADKNSKIDERRKVVMADLSKAEPAVIEAQKSVSNIKKQHLTEVRSMGNPPQAVKVALEAACTLLGHKIESWKSVQSIIRKDDFIASIVNFNTERQMNEAVRERMKRDYTDDVNFNFEVVNRASKACGPLVQWVIAQVNYSEILERVGPLRNEVTVLEADANIIAREATEIENNIQLLESSIAKYKDEYALLISESQALKREMEHVKAKVERSITLVNSLSSEKDRWEESNRTFETQMATLFGDVLLTAAFMAYSGFYDQQHRENMFRNWVNHLNDAGIKFRPELSVIEFLSKVDERLTWQKDGLPADDLCTENAIMLNRFNRYPFIIDPSGQALSFIKKQGTNKVTVTSFSDNAFLKNVESALRFGNTVIIQDVDKVDPILNSILNKEIRRAGGRVLIRLGKQEVDFSTNFRLVLATRNPVVVFPPDLCSRVSFVNFTVTKSSLYNQCINDILRSERPDIDERRRDLMKLQGEFQVRLTYLEKLLLKSLNESSGNILDDDNLISTLEKLKKEASEIQTKVEETSSVMEEVNVVMVIYKPFSQACSWIFGILEQLHQLNHYYQFSLDGFKKIFKGVLENNPNLSNITDYSERLQILQNDIFKATFSGVGPSLLHKDIPIFAMLLAHAKVLSYEGEDSSAVFDLIMDDYYLEDQIPVFNRLSLAATAWDKCLSLTTISNHVKSNQEKWQDLLQNHGDGFDMFVKDIGFEGIIHIVNRFNNIMLLTFLIDEKMELGIRIAFAKQFRKTEVLLAINSFAEQVLGFSVTSVSMDLEHIILNEESESSAIAVCSIQGYDASDRVEHLANDLEKRLNFVAMGSNESITLAETAIAESAKRGEWVLLKNLHLASHWIPTLEKKIRNLSPRQGFRLLFSLEMVPSISVSLLRYSRTVLFEPPPGIKASLHVSLKGVPQSKFTNSPAEKIRLYFLLSWLHAVIQERQRYVPLGWTKLYEFSDADKEWALNIIDQWISLVGHNRTNISPSKIPWDALTTLISHCVYGGRMDNEFDETILNSFVRHLFQSRAFDADFSLTSNPSEQIIVPDSTKVAHFVSWIDKLPEVQPPTWLGLNLNAESVLLSQKGMSAN